MPLRVLIGPFAGVFCLLGILAAQEMTIRVDVKLVRMLVTVKDQAGALVGSLEKSDFRVFDRGVPQEIAVFERQTEQPLSIAILVDASGSTAKEMRYELHAVGRILKAVFGSGNPEDTAALYSFNWRVYLESNYTRRVGRFEQALKRVKSEGGTSLYDAIYLAASDMEDRKGRHVLVVVSDGGDTTSAKDFHAALEAAQLADAVIYPILVTPITNEAGRNVGGENALTTFAQRTGGRVFRPADAGGLDAAFAEILRELRTQYLIGFYPKNVPPAKDRFHPLRVELQRPDLRAITRNGYYGSGEAAGEK